MQHPSRGRTRGRLLATAAVVALSASLPGLTGVLDAQAAPAATGIVQPQEQAVTTADLTLVTGDTVTVTTAADAKQSVDVRAASGTGKTFHTMSGPDGDLFVFPSDAMDGIASQALDRQLFNVTQLLKDGYGDRKADSLPVLVSYGDKPSAATLKERAAALPASERGAVADTLDMAGVRVEKAGARSFWQTVRPVADRTARGKAVTEPSSSGVTKLWYDAKVKVSLDRSVPQIGAPGAWTAGYDGKGVKVAVLDTGIDADHADVRDRVTATRSFVPGVAVDDLQGHGTHVASTIAGSGANSEGKLKGVAPGAELIIGKVLGNDGSGNTSWIIEGMEWAAAQGADVVSMSLGGSAQVGGDPMTEMVDRLSASTDTLFVISAGNSGPSASTLGSPGTADSALTVGAVDKSDVLTNFSSRGPRKGDYAIKPEITAPGAGIVAARAAGTAMGTPVDEFYTSANGTSMATPHVAGAAAILAQRHPDWTGERIKATLTAHAEPGAATTYQQGFGRVDILASLDPKLGLTGTADFGLVEWQEGAYEKETRKLTLSNPTGADTEVTLSTDVSGLPAGSMALSASEVTVPANGAAEVTVTLDPTQVTDGEYTGRINATTTEGATAHTVVGFIKEPRRYGLTLDFKDRLGNTPNRTDIHVLGLDNNVFETYSLHTNHHELRLPAGRYTVTGLINTAAVGNASVSYAGDFFSLDELDLTGKDAGAVIDATKATDFRLDVKDERRPLEDSEFSYQLTRTAENGRYSMRGIAGLSNWNDARHGAIPTGKPTSGTLRTSFYESRREPLIQATVTRPDTFRISALTSSYLNRFEGTKRFDLVDVGGGSAEELAGKDLKGKAAVLHVARGTGATTVAKAVEAAGASAIVMVPTNNAPRGIVVVGVTVPYFLTSYTDGAELADAMDKGRTTVALKGVKESRYAYAGQWDREGGIPKDLTTITHTDDFAKVVDTYHSDGTERMGYGTVHAWGPHPMTSVRSSQFLQQGNQRDQYLFAAPQVAYAHSISARTDYPAAMGETPKALKPGRGYREDWFAPAMHPSNWTSYACNFCRSDAGTVFGGKVGGDSDPDHYLTTGRARTWSYFRDGERITDTTKLMVEEKADYVFVEDNVRSTDHPGVALGTKTRTEYGFSSARPTEMQVEECAATLPTATTCEALPVVLLDYGMKSDTLNRVSADRRHSFTVDASRSKGWTGDTRMAGTKVSVSYDDGATWRAADVDRVDGNSFRASYRAPELSDTNGFVTVRTEVRDNAGNRTVQTITRAYALK